MKIRRKIYAVLITAALILTLLALHGVCRVGKKALNL